MEKKPKVSIVIPVYNGANYVEEAIKSALNQTYKNIEIIVVNDGSTDNTKKVCEKYKDKIRYFDKENGGVSTALNLAISKMTGEYFSWLSHDDLIYPNKIEEEIKYADSNTIVLSNYDFIDKKGKRIERIQLNHDLIENVNQAAVLNAQINGITLLIPKKAFDDCGFFNKDLRCTQDYEMWYRMMIKGYKFKHIEQFLSATRVHNLSQTETNPLVLSEGNALWSHFLDKTYIKTKKEMFNTEYGFYKYMYYFLKTTPYQEACQYALRLADETRKKTIIDKKKISVIVSTNFYQHEEIKKTIDSILEQTYDNFEIILVGKDNYIKSQKIQHIVYNGNNLAESNNIGIKKADSEYICIVRPGDILDKRKLEIQYNEMFLTNDNISYSINNKISNGYILDSMIYSNDINISSMMIKKDFLINNKVTFDENNDFGTEECFILSLLKKSPILCIDIKLVNTVEHNIDKEKTLYSILKYCINDPIISNHRSAIAALSHEYAISCFEHYELEDKYLNIDIIEKYNKITSSFIWKVTKPLRIVSTISSSIENDGIKETNKKIKRYFHK